MTSLLFYPAPLKLQPIDRRRVAFETRPRDGHEPSLAVTVLCDSSLVISLAAIVLCEHRY